MFFFAVLPEVQMFDFDFLFQPDLYFIHASCIFNMSNVKDTIHDNEILRSKDLHVKAFTQLLLESKPGKKKLNKGGKLALAKVEKRYPASQHPWLFIAYSASILSEEEEFALVVIDVSQIIQSTLCSCCIS